MEKMQLGSPASPGANSYLPNFLMGAENPQPGRISFCKLLKKRWLLACHNFLS